MRGSTADDCSRSWRSAAVSRKGAPMTRRRAWAATAAAIAMAASGGAWAQIETRSSAPIDITANEAEVVNSKCLAIWRGAAEALQGETRLRANTITVHEVVKAKGADGQPACG